MEGSSATMIESSYLTSTSCSKPRAMSVIILWESEIRTYKRPLPNSLRIIRLSPASSAQCTNQREVLVRAKVTAEQPGSRMPSPPSHQFRVNSGTRTDACRAVPSARCPDKHPGAQLQSRHWRPCAVRWLAHWVQVSTSGLPSDTRIDEISSPKRSFIASSCIQNSSAKLRAPWRMLCSTHSRTQAGLYQAMHC